MNEEIKTRPHWHGDETVLAAAREMEKALAGKVDTWDKYFADLDSTGRTAEHMPVRLHKKAATAFLYDESGKQVTYHPIFEIVPGSRPNEYYGKAGVGLYRFDVTTGTCEELTAEGFMAVDTTEGDLPDNVPGGCYQKNKETGAWEYGFEPSQKIDLTPFRRENYRLPTDVGVRDREMRTYYSREDDAFFDAIASRNKVAAIHGIDIWSK